MLNMHPKDGGRSDSCARAPLPTLPILHSGSVVSCRRPTNSLPNQTYLNFFVYAIQLTFFILGEIIAYSQEYVTA